MHLLSLWEIEKKDFLLILQKAKEYKSSPNKIPPLLKGKCIGLFFEKPSTRTRISLEVAISYLEGRSFFYSPQDIQVSRGESIEDTAKVFSLYLNGVCIRSSSHAFLEEFARFSSIPVINALSPLYHPLQIFADFLTIEENGLLKENFQLSFVGDGNNNIARTLIVASSLYPFSLKIISPPGYFPDPSLVEKAKKKGARIFISSQIEEVENSDVLYTDIWVSMGQEKEKEKREKDFLPYQVNKKLLSFLPSYAILLHCLPAHKGKEITEDAFSSSFSRIYQQAENRLWSSVAILSYVFS